MKTIKNNVEKKKVIGNLLDKKFDMLAKVNGSKVASCSSIKVGCGPGYCHTCPDGCLNNCTAVPGNRGVKN